MLAATVIFVIGVIVVDFGLWLSERRRAQTAADLAALAAVSVLDQGHLAAEAKALDFADRNGYTNGSGSVEVDVTPGFGGNPDEVEVTIKEGSQALFLGVFIGRLDISIDIGASAVATRAAPANPTPPAVLALDNSCGANALLILGSNLNVTGGTHTNSTATVTGSGNTFDGGFNYACSPLDDSGGGNTYTPSHAPGSRRSSPLGYSYGDFNCNHEFTSDADVRSEPSLWQGNDPNTNQLNPGVICSTGNLALGGSDVTGNVTLVAQGEIDIGGSNFNLTPRENNVFLFAGSTNSSALNVIGTGGSWEGFLYAPDGGITLSGSAGANFNASIIGNQVTISGSGFSLDSSTLSDPSGGQPVVHLVD